MAVQKVDLFYVGYFGDLSTEDQEEILNDNDLTFEDLENEDLDFEFYGYLFSEETDQYLGYLLGDFMKHEHDLDGIHCIGSTHITNTSSHSISLSDCGESGSLLWCY